VIIVLPLLVYWSLQHAEWLTFLWMAPCLSLIQRKPKTEEKLQMITDDLDERPDLLRGELAVFSEDQSPFFVKGENITAVVGNLPGTQQCGFIQAKDKT
jgi:hypothetical protein